MPITNHPLSADPIIIGIDVGSTTVKPFVVDPSTRAIIWSQYQRHETRQAETVLQQLVAIGKPIQPDSAGKYTMVYNRLGHRTADRAPGGKFVQEVNAVGVSDGVQSLLTAPVPAGHLLSDRDDG